MAYYRTELTEKILTSESAKTALGKLAPIYGEAYVFLWLLQSIGTRLDTIDGWIDEFKAQTVPQTATWSIAEWEKRYGISINETLPLETRRAAVLAKMWSNCPMPPARLERIATDTVGADVSITENPGKNTFIVTVTSSPAVVAETAVRAVIDPLKPAHLSYKVGYVSNVATAAALGGAVQKYKEITLSSEE